MEPPAGSRSIETPPRTDHDNGHMETDEATTVRVLLERIVARGPEPSLRRTTANYRFDLENAGRWDVKLVAGAPVLSDDATQPDCVINTTAADFIEIAEGKRNLVSAFLRGRLRITGDIALAMALRHLYPVAP
jgi:putative sterol carrier protein